MTENTDRRIERLEGTVDRVVVILEGKPVYDIDGLKIDTKGGIVKQGERHEEMLHVVSHQLTTIIDDKRKPWSRTQRIAASGVLVMAFGSFAMWIGA